MEAVSSSALIDDDFCETTSRVNAITDAEEELSKRHGNSTGQMKTFHQDFRKTLAEIK